jgi:hypothetical protein
MAFLTDYLNARMFTNSIKWKDPAGNYVEDTWQFIHDFFEQLKRLPTEEGTKFSEEFRAQVEEGMCEEVLSYSKKLANEQNIIFHFAQVRARNTVQNIRRLFHHVTAVIAVNFDFGGDFNLSVERIRKAIDCHNDLRQAHWYIIQTEYSEPLIEFLEELGCEYKMLLPEIEKGGHVNFVMQDMESNLSAIAH